MTVVKRFLNVGGGSKAIKVPRHYLGWEHLLLDIDPAGKPDICADARNMTELAPAQFDAVYCSHNLEHYYEHDVPRVLAGFRHVLKPEGFAEIRVPDMLALMRLVVETKVDFDDKLYDTPMGPVRPKDIVYGFAPEIQKSGQDFYAHKTGFSHASLTAALKAAGFTDFVALSARPVEIAIAAFLAPPPAETMATLLVAAP